MDIENPYEAHLMYMWCMCDVFHAISIGTVCNYRDLIDYIQCWCFNFFRLLKKLDVKWIKMPWSGRVPESSFESCPEMLCESRDEVDAQTGSSLHR